MGRLSRGMGTIGVALVVVAQLVALGWAAPVAAADPIRVDVCVTDSADGVLVPGATYYKIGSTFAFANTLDGTTNCKYQSFPAGTTNLEVWTTYNNTLSAHLTQDISVDPVFDFQTSEISVRVQDASSTGVAGAQVRFGGPSGTAYYFPGQPTGATGQVAAQLFPGTYAFNAGLNYTSATKTQNVATDPLVVFDTTNLTLGYSGVIAFGGPTGDSAFFTPHSREFFPGTVNFRFDFTAGGPIRLPITIGATALTKSMIVARVLDPSATPIMGIQISAEPGALSLGTTNANGIAYALVDGALGSETVAFSYSGQAYSLTQHQPSNSIYRFVASALEAPTVTPTITGTLGNNGWFVSDVTVSWTIGGGPADTSSGCETSNVTTDTAGVTFACTASNGAGSDSESVTIKRDTTAPWLDPSVSPNPVMQDGLATAGAGASDGLSGVATWSCDAVDTSDLGPQSVDCTATDNAGNSAGGSASYLVYALPEGGGAFVVGNRSAAGRIYFWGSQWAKFNLLSGGAAPSAFKGYAPDLGSLTCGAQWRSGPGNSAQPPAGPLPEYMAVIVANGVTKSGSVISGNTVQVLVVKVDSGYDGNPGHPGTGTVVATVC